MNKSLLKIALVVALSMCAASAYSASTALSGTNVNVGGNSFSASTKVSIGVMTNATGSGATDGTNYVAESVHSSGDKLISSSSGDARIYWKTTAVGTTAPPSIGAATIAYDSSWTTM